MRWLKRLRVVPQLGFVFLIFAAGPSYPQSPAADGYVGSQACSTCHPKIYARWKNTRMANVVRDLKEHPEAIIPDLSKPDALVKFTKADIAFVYGSKWKQRYFTKRGDDYYPLGAQWDVTHQIWRPYMVAPNTDWWVPFYPADNTQRPTGRFAMGAILPTTTFRRRQSRSGMSAAKSATAPVPCTRRIRRRPTL
jgi:hypothetical protein